MALRDGKQYVESLRDGREVYIHGERVDDITKHPSLRKAIDHGAIDYELDKRPELRDLLVTRSPKTGSEIRRYFELPRTAEDLLRRHELIETTTRNGGSVVIFMKEIGTDALNALNMGRYKVGAVCIGSAKRAFFEAVKYAKQRVQFGKPTIEFTNNQFKTVEPIADVIVKIA